MRDWVEGAVIGCLFTLGGVLFGSTLKEEPDVVVPKQHVITCDNVHIIHGPDGTKVIVEVE